MFWQKIKELPNNFFQNAHNSSHNMNTFLSVQSGLLCHLCSKQHDM